MDRDRGLAVRLGAGVVLAVLLPAIWTIAEQAPQSSDSRSIVLVMELAATREGGPTGADAAPSTPRLVVGQPYTRYFETGEGGLCTVASVPKSTLLSLPYQWKVEAELVSVGADSSVFDVNWSRMAGGEARGRRRITLKPGEQHILDFVSSSEGRCPNAVLRIRLPEVQAEPGAEQVLEYDLWLVHRSAAGREDTRHLAAFAAENEQHRFRFEPLRWNPKGTIVDKPVRPGIEMHVSGTLTSRIEDAEVVSLILNTESRVQASGEPIWTRGKGTKTLSIALNQPVSIAIPPPTGSLRLRTSQPLESVDLGQLFGASETALVITVRKAQ